MKPMSFKYRSQQKMISTKKSETEIFENSNSNNLFNYIQKDSRRRASAFRNSSNNAERNPCKLPIKLFITSSSITK